MYQNEENELEPHHFVSIRCLGEFRRADWINVLAAFCQIFTCAMFSCEKQKFSHNLKISIFPQCHSFPKISFHRMHHLCPEKVFDTQIEKNLFHPSQQFSCKFTTKHLLYSHSSKRLFRLWAWSTRKYNTNPAPERCGSKSVFIQQESQGDCTHPIHHTHLFLL